MKSIKTKSTAARPPKELKTIESLCLKSIQSLGYDWTIYPVFEAWDNLLGPEAAKARAVGVKNNKLHIEVDNSVYLHEMVLRRKGLLKKLLGYFGPKPPVNDIIVELAGRRKG